MFAGDSQMLRNKRHFVISVIAINMYYCNFSFINPAGLWKDVSHEKDVWLAFGCHPKSATDFSMQYYNGLRACLQHEKVVALGEIGLDYSGRLVQVYLDLHSLQ